MRGRNTEASVSLADFINTERERKKNEALAQRVFGKGRRNSVSGAAASGGKRRAGASPSLASRVGVQKQRSTSTVFQKQRGKPAGNVDVEWTHDLHRLNNPVASRVSQLPHQNSRGGRGQARNEKRSLTAMNGAVSYPAENSAFNIVKPKPTSGMTIRGLAGSYTIVAKNLAPGTSAADVECKMGPVGGDIRSCEIVATHPTTAEIVFESKAGADNVIATFHRQTYDGRLLSVFFKPIPISQTMKQPAASVIEKPRSVHGTRPSPPTRPRADYNSRPRNYHYEPQERSNERSRNYERGHDQVVDGSGRGRGLYSDNLVNSDSKGRW